MKPKQHRRLNTRSKYRKLLRLMKRGVYPDKPVFIPLWVFRQLEKGMVYNEVGSYTAIKWLRRNQMVTDNTLRSILQDAYHVTTITLQTANRVNTPVAKIVLDTVIQHSYNIS